MASSSTTSSPTKRSALSPKPSNILLLSPTRKSPLKQTANASSSHLGNRLSPLKNFISNVSSSSSPIPSKRPKLNFTIYEDKPAQSEDSSSEQQQQEEITNKLNHQDQENILQPSKQVKSGLTPKNVTSAYRKPLSNLNINEYPGYIANTTTSSSTSMVQLTELYQPTNYNNDFKSLHKFQTIPSYLTPSRKNKTSSINNRFLFYSNNKLFGDTEEIEEDIEVDDEIELHLLKKQNNTHMRRHKRSFSVGTNESKLNLIKKNNFTILSN